MSQTMKRPQGYTQAEVFNCIICNYSISTESTQRGMQRTKCDYCIKEKDRLVNTMRYWMKKVGVYFDLNGDWS